MAARVCDGSAAKPWFGGFILGFTSQGSPFHLGDVAESLPPLGLVGAELLWEMLCPGGSCDHPGPAGALWGISGALHEIYRAGTTFLFTFLFPFLLCFPRLSDGSPPCSVTDPLPLSHCDYLDNAPLLCAEIFFKLVLLPHEEGKDEKWDFLGFFWRLMTRKSEPAAESQHKHLNWGLGSPQCSSARRGPAKPREQ